MHAPKHLVWPLIVSGLYGLLLSGCSTEVGDSINIPMGELALHGSIPRTEAIAKLERHLEEAKTENMPFLAPHYFREASDILKNIQRKSPKNVSVEEISRVDVTIDKGESVIEIVKFVLGKELEIKELLDKQKAGEIYPWRYRMIIYDLSKLIEKVELDRAGNIERDKEDLNKSMQALYDKTVEYTSSHESQITGKDTKGKDGEK